MVLEIYAEYIKAIYYKSHLNFTSLCIILDIDNMDMRRAADLFQPNIVNNKQKLSSTWID